MTYSEKLKDPRWQKKQLEILERDNWMCQDCFNSKKTLHVHHLKYEKGKNPWEYDNKDLITICENCHKDRIEFEKLDKYLDKLVQNVLNADYLNFKFDLRKIDHKKRFLWNFFSELFETSSKELDFGIGEYADYIRCYLFDYLNIEIKIKKKRNV